MNRRITLALITLSLLIGFVLLSSGRGTNAKAARTAVPLLPATLTVTNTSDSGAGSLRQAIADAASGDTIDFSLSSCPCTITLVTPLLIDKDLTIQGPGAQQLTVSGNSLVRVFRIAAGNFNVTLSDLTIANGRNSGSSAEGGGIFNESTGTLNVTNCTVSGNSVVNNNTFGDAIGGGLANNGTGTVNVTNCTFSGNSAGGSADALGGGISNSTHSTSETAGTMNITNTTIAGNSATTSSATHGGVGGGVYNQTGTVNVTNSTIAGNSASGGSATFGGRGGGISNNIGLGTGPVNVKNTIIALNTASNSGPDVSGPFTSLGYNLIGDDTGSTGFGATGDQLNVSDPGLELNSGQPFLKDNGGPTKTIALLCGSPAIDAGSNALAVDPDNALTTDQRGTGFPRIVYGTVDIGAFEFVDTTLPTISNASASPASLWPPNHTMRDVTVNYDPSDICGTVTCELTVTSNEPINGLGDGDTAPDWEIVDGHHVRLRAERSGKGSGRMYTVTITCMDGLGNTKVKTVKVSVPKNQR